MRSMRSSWSLSEYMVPDFQTLMRPVLNQGSEGEVAISDVVETLADEFNLSESERNELLPSGKQTRFANRVHWAKSYLKQAGLVENTKRGHYRITEIGKSALESGEEINRDYLEQYEAYQDFKSRTNQTAVSSEDTKLPNTNDTPDEILRAAHNQIKNALLLDLLERMRDSSPAFFEQIIVDLLIAMGYGTSKLSGRLLGRSGDDGVDGVINQDPLGVDQVYVQAKRYAETNKIGAGAIRDFYGALGLKDVTKGIFVTTSAFSESAVQTAEKLGARIVLIDGVRLAELMVEHRVGCRIEQTYPVYGIDENYFE